jgi:hypothetical protein
VFNQEIPCPNVSRQSITALTKPSYETLPEALQYNLNLAFPSEKYRQLQDL